MAFWSEPPRFEHPDLPFVQAWVLELVLSSAGRVHVVTWTDDDGESRLHLLADRGETLEWSGSEGEVSIYRYSRLAEFPRKKIEWVDLSVDNAGRILEIRLQVAGAGIHLIAGEVEEGTDGLTARKGDLIVLIFFNDDALGRTRFDTPI
ncbi:MAG: hypothetical protein FWD68_07210 [Alphaproteobacteria bacterium]|nr:hypothetical protein [Alphaproteobacteria bacterium]